MTDRLVATLFAVALASFVVTPSHADFLQPKDRLGWASFRGLSTSKYEKKLDEYKAKGYLPVDVEIQIVDEQRRYSVVFRKNPRKIGWGIFTRLDSGQYHAKWEEYRDKGYMPVDVETYVLGGKLYFGGIWHKNVDGRGWSSRRKMDSSEFHEWFDEMRAKGYRPVDVDGTPYQGDTLFSGIWVKNVEKLSWAIRRNVKESDYGKLFDELKRKGMRTYDLDAYQRNGSTHFATIWIKEPRAWAARRGMTSTSYHNWWARYRDDGLRPVDVEAYSTSKGTRYAGVWVSNKTERLHWGHKSEVDGHAQSFGTTSKAKGYAVGVAHQGEIKFVRGYGFADEDAGKKAHGETLFRLASVSKAVTGTLGFVLEDDGEIDLGDDIQSVLPALPAQHDYELGELLTNRSLVRHYVADDPVGDLGHVEDAWDAVEVFKDDDVVENDDGPDDGYQYSTHGYTVFAAAVEEEVSGKSFCQTLRDRLTKPQRVDIRCENTAVADSERSKLYGADDDGVDLVSYDDISWKYAGGGMESTIVDMLRFGMRLDRNQILAETRVTEMTTPPDSNENYAYGWSTGSHDGLDYYGKGGDQRGSQAYIRIYPDDDLIVVVLANTRGSGDTTFVKETAKTVLLP